LIALVGPTASGKSSVALELVEQLEFRGIPTEILSADSMQVYRYMDIGTAKPDAETRRRIPHHLIDLVEPTQNYSVSKYRDDASEVLRRLIGEGKAAIVVGGTGLYVKALIDGLNRAPSADLATRSRLEAEAKEAGRDALHRRLVRVDPDAASKIHPHNIRRIVRALEVFELSSVPFSQFHKEQIAPPWRDQFA